jgi:hypothetical protein
MSGKSTLVNALKDKYKIDQDTAYILPLRQVYKGQKKSEMAIPLQFITDLNRKKIDD